MPGYGVLGPDEGSGLLAWSWAAERLTDSHDYFLATVRPDGRPHMMPVWGVWSGSSLWFSSGADSRKARNIAGTAAVVVATDDASAPVVVEGSALRIEDGADVEWFAAALNAKYESDYPVQFFLDNACYRVDAARVFGIDTEDFAGTPTRWDLS